MPTTLRTNPPTRTAFRAFVDAAYLTVVAPSSFREQLRRAGIAFLAEALFLLLISAAAPVGSLALASLLAGEILVVASFAPSPRSREA